YVVYGNINQNVALSLSQYRVEQVPPELEVMSYSKERHADVLSSFLEGYLWEKLKQEDPDLADLIASQTSCMILRGYFPDSPTLNYLRDTVGLIAHFLHSGGVTVYDPQMFHWWNPRQWEERIFAPATAVPRHHTIILVSKEPGGTEWIHTRGMR